MTKAYVVDTNVLIDNPDVIGILTNGEDGKDKNQVYLTHTIINELDGLKRDNKLRPQVQEVIHNLIKYKDMIHIIGLPDSNYNNDNKILAEMIDTKIDSPILVTSDLLMRFKAEVCHDIETQEFKESMPFKSDSEGFTGFVEAYDNETPNCFGFEEGKLHIYNPFLDPVPIPEHELWKIKPKTAYQNAAMYLITDDDIDIVSIQSPAGLGKSLISLASALYLTLEKKQYKTIMTRMGENVKCIINGDTNQVDNGHLNTENNGLNWIVRMLKGQHNYGHIVLQGSRSRGPICDTVLKSGL